MSDIGKEIKKIEIERLDLPSETEQPIEISEQKETEEASVPLSVHGLA